MVLPLMALKGSLRLCCSSHPYEQRVFFCFSAYVISGGARSRLYLQNLRFLFTYSNWGKVESILPVKFVLLLMGEIFPLLSRIINS